MTSDWFDAPRHPDDPPSLDTRIAHPARIYDAWLGGKDNFAVDRVAAEAGVRAFPAAVASMRSNRAFLARVVAYLAAERGIRQFLDIGTGLPAADNIHEVAQKIAPECRVAYVDNDPLVLLHANVLMSSTEPGAIVYIDADLRDPERILEMASGLLDYSQPTAVLLFGILHFIPDEESPYLIVDRLMEAMPTGSYLAVSHLAKDLYPDRMAAFADVLNEHSSEQTVLRDHAEVGGFFDGLELVEPGVVQVSRWRPRTGLEAGAPAALWGGVARKASERRHGADGTG